MLEAGHDYDSVGENMQETLGNRPAAGSMRKVHRYIHNKEHNVLHERNISRPASCLTSSQKNIKERRDINIQTRPPRHTVRGHIS
jgi:hypothetical protein